MPRAGPRRASPLLNEKEGRKEGGKEAHRRTEGKVCKRCIDHVWFVGLVYFSFAFGVLDFTLLSLPSGLPFPLAFGWLKPTGAHQQTQPVHINTNACRPNQSENGDEHEDGIDEADGVGDEPPLLAHAERLLEEPRRGVGRPGDGDDGEGAACVHDGGRKSRGG